MTKKILPLIKASIYLKWQKVLSTVHHLKKQTTGTSALLDTMKRHLVESELEEAK